MIIKSMTASFGKLENARLELKPGLNVIYAPNEAGKSTWCGFIRTMLYGVSTSQREKSGVIPDKKRFLPWGSYSMGGSMDITFQNTDITLSRSGSAGKPMGNCTATLSGTAQKLPELCGKAPGETLIGVPESVFRRSAFISGSAMALDPDSELEKRISALITSGSDEDESFLAASDALHKKQVKLKHNAKVGKIPELTARLGEINAALNAIEEKNRLIGDDFAELTELNSRRDELENELRRAEMLDALESQKKLAAARAERESAEKELASVKAALGNTDLNAVNAARAALSACREAAAAYDGAQSVEAQYSSAKAETESAELAAAGVSAEGISLARRALFEYETAWDTAKACEAELNGLRLSAPAPQAAPRRSKLGAFAALAAVLALIFALAYIPLRVIALPIAAAVLLIAAAVLFASASAKNGEIRREAALKSQSARESEQSLISRAEAARAREKSAAAALADALCAINAETVPERAKARIDERERDLARLDAARRVELGLSPALEKAKTAQSALNDKRSALSAALVALGGNGDTENAEAVINEKSALLARLTAAESALAAALRLETGLGASDIDLDLTYNAPDETPPARDKELISRELESINPRRAELERSLALFEGELKHLGDPVVLATEAGEINEQIKRCETEYSAVELALSVLSEANSELQTRFAPIVGSLAGKLFAEMTDGRYDKISFDRDFRFSASGSGLGECEAEYLSSGASAQLYLAARLAVCELALPANEKCPLILDDALICFDDERAKSALKLLSRLSADRQIILFTCHSREGKMLEDLS